MPYGIDPRSNFLASLFGFDEEPAEKPTRITGRTRRGARGYVKKTTREEEIQRIARENIARREAKRVVPSSDFLESFSSSVGNTFGIAPRIAAIPRSFINDRSYGDEFDVIQAEEALTRDKSTTGNLLGLLYGGAGAVKVGAAGITRLADRGSRGAQAAQRVGQALSLKKGKTLSNAAKLSVVAGTAGGAQALGEGTDIGRGVGYGAAAGPVLIGGGKGLEVITRPARDFLKASSAAGILRRYTSVTSEWITKEAAKFRQRTGAEPTVYELLPLEDRQGVQSMIRWLPSQARETLAGKVRGRAANIGPELSRRVEDVTDPQQRDTILLLADRLAESRGVTAASADDIAQARKAIGSPVDIEEFGRQEAKNIMAPIEKTVLFKDIRELFPVSPQGSGGSVRMVVSDPEAVAVIRNKAGRLSKDITGGDVSKVIRRLESVPPGSIEKGAAERALDAIYTKLDDIPGKPGEIIAKMRSRFAEVQRIREGMNEGARSRLRESIPVENREGAQRIRNAFDTPEGDIGRAAGQAGRLARDVTAAPGAATRAVGEIAENPTTQEAIARNIGPEARDTIVDAAAAQTDSARRLSGLAGEQRGGFSEGASLPDLARGLIALSPSSLPSTKAWAAARFLRLFSHLPKKQSEQIVDALFSQNPAQMGQALRLLNNAGDTGQAFLRQISTAVIGGQLGSKIGDSLSADPAADITADQPPAEIDSPEEADYSQMSDDELLQLYDQQSSGDTQDYSQMSDDELLQLYGQQSSAPYGRSIIESVFPGAEVTDDVRDPNSKLGRANPKSAHNRTDAAVDVRPIPGLTFEQFVQELRDSGQKIVEARDEVNNPSGHATGPHWHVVFG